MTTIARLFPRLASWHALVLAAAVLLGAPAATAGSPSPDEAARRAAERFAVGTVQNFTVHPTPQPLVDTPFKDRDDRALSLTNFRGKVVLINLWATWCAPCRHEMPGLDRLQADLGGGDFQVVALSLDRSGMDRVLEFFEEIGIKHLTPYIDKTTKASRAFRAFGLPTSILIGRDGRELGRLVGPAEWASPEAKALLNHFINATEKVETRPGDVDPS